MDDETRMALAAIDQKLDKVLRLLLMTPAERDKMARQQEEDRRES